MAKAKGGNRSKLLSKERKKEKQWSKANKKNKKKNEIEEEHVETIIATIKNQKLSHTATASSSSTVMQTPPLPRSHCSLTLSNNGDVVLFGGECYDSQNVKSFKTVDETYRWNVEQNEWKSIDTSVKPIARCSHQAVAYKDDIYVFGGEFATNEQFYHFRDLWKFNLKTNLWEAIETTGKAPTPRSGHRMVIWRNLLVCFGGFYSTARGNRYYNDLYLLSFQDFVWTQVNFTSTVPEPRSGCIFVASLQSDYILMYGGLSVTDTGKNVKPKYYQDCWMLNMKPLSDDKVTSPTWEKIRKSGTFPSIRTGMAGASFKNLAILFGGVYDEETEGLKLKSVFYNDLYTFDFDKRSFFALSLRSRGSKSKKQDERIGNTLKEHHGETNGIDVSSSRFPGVNDERKMGKKWESSVANVDVAASAMNRQLDASDEDIDVQFEGITDRLEADICGSNATALNGDGFATVGHTANRSNTGAPTKTVDTNMNADGRKAMADADATAVSQEQIPCSRMCCNLVVKGNNLYVYGGIVGMGDSEIYLNDYWSLNLIKREKWNCLYHSEQSCVVRYEESDSDGSQVSDMETDGSDSDANLSDEEEEGDDMDDEMMDSDEFSSDSDDEDLVSEVNTDACKDYKRELSSRMHELSLNDADGIPKKNESLREFFIRTKEVWLTQVDRSSETNGLPEKERQREAFRLAQQHYKMR